MLLILCKRNVTYLGDIQDTTLNNIVAGNLKGIEK